MLVLRLILTVVDRLFFVKRGEKVSSPHKRAPQFGRRDGMEWDREEKGEKELNWI